MKVLAGLAVAALQLALAGPADARERRHRVLEGETAFTIAWRYGVDWEDIAARNRLRSGGPLRPGQELRIPEPSATRTLAPVAQPMTRFVWPVEGVVRRGFAGGRRKHDGIDIVAVAGQPVRAITEGRVLFAGFEPQEYGYLVIVDHGHGWLSAYAHLSRITVREGTRLRAGQRLGEVGRTGHTDHDELHFELRRDNRPFDPSPFLPNPR
jgi:murein DD-endopeptidase MepM/ murein hydrolase activator NlpD